MLSVPGTRPVPRPVTRRCLSVAAPEVRIRRRAGSAYPSHAAIRTARAPRSPRAGSSLARRDVVVSIPTRVQLGPVEPDGRRQGRHDRAGDGDLQVVVEDDRCVAVRDIPQDVQQCRIVGQSGVGLGVGHAARSATLPENPRRSNDARNDARYRAGSRKTTMGVTTRGASRSRRRSASWCVRMYDKPSAENRTTSADDSTVARTARRMATRSSLDPCRSSSHRSGVSSSSRMMSAGISRWLGM